MMILNESDRCLHFTSSQPWKEKACAISTLSNFKLINFSNKALLADKLACLLAVFFRNGYPDKAMWRILHQETGPKSKNGTSLCAPSHPKAKTFKNPQNVADLGGLDPQKRQAGLQRIQEKYCTQASSAAQKYGRAKPPAHWKNDQRALELPEQETQKENTENIKQEFWVKYHHHVTAHTIDLENADSIP